MNVRVYVLDSGYPVHPDLYNNIKNIFNTPQDFNGHSTHVCGIIKDWFQDVEIVPIKITSVTPDIELIQSALKQIIKSRSTDRIDIINMSLNYSRENRTIYKYIKTLYKYNIPLICSAGNTNGQECWYPAKHTETISISSYGNGYKISKFSPEDSRIDFYADGENIRSTWIADSWRTLSGTSQAAPMVTGIVAKLLSLQSRFISIPELMAHLIENSREISAGKLRIVPEMIYNYPIKVLDSSPELWFNILIKKLKGLFNAYIANK